MRADGVGHDAQLHEGSDVTRPMDGARIALVCGDLHVLDECVAQVREWGAEAYLVRPSASSQRSPSGAPSSSCSSTSSRTRPCACTSMGSSGRVPGPRWWSSRITRRRDGTRDSNGIVQRSHCTLGLDDPTSGSRGGADRARAALHGLRPPGAALARGATTPLNVDGFGARRACRPCLV